MGLNRQRDPLEWRHSSNTKMYAMCRTPAEQTRQWSTKYSAPNSWMVFGRIEPDITGRLVASATEFDHIKYVDSYEDGVLHIEAIYALEG